ncbi:nicotinate-nucleotide adenylyltransferase [Priestia koreensis]|uniref:nicotinate-nucleotide adenylyltransferase n=1 Tax=Priestia koreensis TaxID=284581 RepID=UPI001F57CF32|nr:nicotinate-nucleotide adenylyltransferase [Priestia koreensis]MCM3002561.1 nicotinate-nucleotide adenylyltransferase [Priestia koreensis]UNL84268.1 nicotinate-nucleotide adenylyltransferase [Priestia koreensis]
MKRIGILGGTFNPPHLGHLAIANEVLHALELDKVWFLPSYIPPHKEIKKGMNPLHRLSMIERAVKDNEQFEVQPIEFEKKGTSYTIETMQLLQEMYPDHQFYFIIGGDMIEYLPKWHRIDELVEVVNFVGVQRPGFDIETPYPIQRVEIPQLEISSSFIRDRVTRHETIRYFVPDTVKRYIEENHLYES